MRSDCAPIRYSEPSRAVCASSQKSVHCKPGTTRIVVAAPGTSAGTGMTDAVWRRTARCSWTARGPALDIGPRQRRSRRSNRLGAAHGRDSRRSRRAETCSCCSAPALPDTRRRRRGMRGHPSWRRPKSSWLPLRSSTGRPAEAVARRSAATGPRRRSRSTPCRLKRRLGPINVISSVASSGGLPTSAFATRCDHSSITPPATTPKR